MLASLPTPAATLAELKTACAGASSDFIVAQLEAGATCGSAVQAYNADLQTRLAVAEQNQQVQRVAGNPSTAAGSLQATASGGSGGGADPIAAFERLVAEECGPSGDRMSAFQSCVSAHPVAYASYREAVASMPAAAQSRRRRRRVGGRLVRTGAAEVAAVEV